MYNQNEFVIVVKNYSVIINPRRACAARVTVVVLCVCVCVSLFQLTSRMLIRAKNEAACLASNEDQMICVIFSENASFKSYGVICLP